MGKLGGFLQIERHGRSPAGPARARARLQRVPADPAGGASWQPRAPAAWTAASRSATTAARSGNLIPDWNDLVYRDRFADAIAQLHATNNFPEFTGRLCPAPCEAACVLEIREGDAVTIKQIENSIINRAWRGGLGGARSPPRRESGQAVAVVGSGPAGMAAAQQLRRAGHRVTLFERDEAVGGLVRFGVPDFKIEKVVVAAPRRAADRRGRGGALRRGGGRRRQRARSCAQSFDAVVLATGSRVPRDLPVSRPGARRRALRDGLPLPAQSLRRARARPRADRARSRGRAGDQRCGQGRGRDRRRRHRARTASATPFARAPARSSSSSCSPSRRRTGPTSGHRGRSGR